MSLRFHLSSVSRVIYPSFDLPRWTFLVLPPKPLHFTKKKKNEVQESVSPDQQSVSFRFADAIYVSIDIVDGGMSAVIDWIIFKMLGGWIFPSTNYDYARMVVVAGGGRGRETEAG